MIMEAETEYATWRDRKIKQLKAQKSYDFSDLCAIVTILRGEGGCPWDREQDHHSIRKGMIEECYEVVEAIDREDFALLREELGDVLLQIVFHSDIEKDAGRFNIRDVANDECVKMIARHPHVFGTVKVGSAEEVLDNWEKIKSVEKQRNTVEEKLRSIPPMLPALMRAQKVAKKAEIPLCADKLTDEIKSELDSLGQADPEMRKDRMGRILFDLSLLCRAYDVEGEEALSAETERRIRAVCSE